MKITFAMSCCAAALALWLGRPSVAESLRSMLKNEMAQESTLAAAAASRALVSRLEAAVHRQFKPETTAHAALATPDVTKRGRAVGAR